MTFGTKRRWAFDDIKPGETWRIPANLAQAARRAAKYYCSENFTSFIFTRDPETNDLLIRHRTLADSPAAKQAEYQKDPIYRLLMDGKA